MFEIEKGVKVPENSRAGRRAKYPWAQMGVGDSFFVPAAGKDAGRVQSTMCCLIKQQSDRHGTKFTTSKVEGGVRVWRIE